MTSFTLWTIFAANSPDESSWIGLKEKQMITASLTAGGSRRVIFVKKIFFPNILIVKNGKSSLE